MNNLNRGSAKPSAVLKSAISLAARGDCVGLKKMIAADAELATEPRILNEAALHGKSLAVKLLLDAGADPNGRVPSHEGYRPLHRAIEHRGIPKNLGHIETLEILLEAGASLELRATWMQLVPLAIAGMVGDIQMVDLLQAGGAEKTLFLAAITGDASEVRRSLKRKNPATRRDANNMTALHYAALSGLKERGPELRDIAIRLLDAGADGNACENIGPYPATPVLHFAAWGNFAVAEALLMRGCNPNLGFGNCLWKEPAAMAELFLSYGADVNGREPSGQPLVHSRIHWNLPSVALWLLKNGADPNLTDSEGNTALHEAARRGINLKVIDALLSNGAVRGTKNHRGMTAFEIAQAKRCVRIVDLLR